MDYNKKYKEALKKFTIDYKLMRPSMYYFFKLFLLDLNIYFAENMLDIDNGFMLISNHASNIDPPLLMMLPREIKFLAKKELTKYPVFGWNVKRSAIVLDRERPTQALKDGIKALKNGDNIGIFIEGTRQEEGKLQTAKNGAAFIAMKTKCPILPVAIRNTGKILRKKSVIPRFANVDIVVGKPLNMDKYYKTDSKNLDEISQYFLSAIKQLYDMKLDYKDANTLEYHWF